MKASEARKIAFAKVGKTYESGLNMVFNIVYSAINKAANEGTLETVISVREMLHYFDELKSSYVKKAIVELVRTRLTEDGYDVHVVSTNLSQEKWVEISW